MIEPARPAAVHADAPASDAQVIEAAERVFQAGRDLAPADRTPGWRRDLATRYGLGALNLSASLSHATIARVVSIIASGDVSMARAIRDHVGLIERVRDVPDTVLLDSALRGLWFGASHPWAETLPRLSQVGETLYLSGSVSSDVDAFDADLLTVEASDDDGHAVLVFVSREIGGLSLIDTPARSDRHYTGGRGIVLDRVEVRADHIVLSDRTPGRQTLVSVVLRHLDAAIDVGVAAAAIDATIAVLRRPTGEGDHPIDDPFAFRDIAASKVRLHAAEATIRRAGLTIDAAVLKPSDDGLVNAGVAVDEAGLLAAEVATLAQGTLGQPTGLSPSARSELDRRQRDPRAPARDPIAWRFRAVGDFVLNGVAPPRPFGI